MQLGRQTGDTPHVHVCGVHRQELLQAVQHSFMRTQGWLY